MENTAPQTSLKLEQPEKPYAQKLMWLFTAMLRLYPAAFRTAFADEMRDVFAMSLFESSGRMERIGIMFREIILFPLSLIAAYRTAFNQLPAPVRRRQKIVWFVRIIGGLLGLILLTTIQRLLSPSYNLYPQAVPFVVALFVASANLLFSLRWGRVGGLLTIISGGAVGCCMTLYVYVMGLDKVGIIGTVLFGLVWALPFLIFGILFYQLSYPPKQSPIRA
jgi:hypothetical protein